MSILSRFFGMEETCPICGEKMTFFGSTMLEDGSICDNCVGKIKYGTNLQLYWLRRGMDPDDPEKWDRSDTDPVAALKVEEAAAILRPFEDENQAIVRAFSKAYRALFRVDEVFPMVDLSEISVGRKREKSFQNSTVTRGFVLTGEFAEKDAADAVHLGKITNTNVIEPVPFDPDLPFETVIGAHMYKGPVKAGRAAWLILEEGGGLAAGDVVGIRP